MPRFCYLARLVHDRLTHRRPAEISLYDINLP